MFIKLVYILLGMTYAFNLVFAGDVKSHELNIHPGRLLQFNQDSRLSHQGILAGIPQYFDWAKNPRLSSISRTKSYEAIIGWGHALWNDEYLFSSDLLQIKNFQFLICYGKERKWLRLQSGNITGGQFNTNFKNNEAKKATIQNTINDITTVSFEHGQVFHFWPKQGRSLLPNEEIHGILTLLEARMVDKDGKEYRYEPLSHFLIGGGADLWKKMNSKWDHFESHTDLGVGRMKYVGPNWTWYGFSNASDSDLKILSQYGYQIND